MLKKELLLSFVVLCLSCTCLTFNYAASTSSFDPEKTLEITRRAANWQLANPYTRFPVGHWINGVFLNGLYAIGQMPDNQRYIYELITLGNQEKWGVIKTPWPANDHCAPQTWLELYEDYKAPVMLEPIQKALDEIMVITAKENDNLDFKPENYNKWSWCDALYMAPPTFARMAKVTCDKKYLDYMHEWWWKVSDYYYDEEESLYFRDEKYFTKKEPNGSKVFWSRGNGWVVGGLVRVLQYLPENDPLRVRYEQQLKEMCTKLAQIQRPDGLWSSGLLDPSHQPETSGSAFFVYGIAYAINENLIDKERFIPVLEKAWPALCGYVQEDGRFTGVQPVGEAPESYNKDKTAPYGVGAFLLAGSEVYRLACPTVAGH